MIQNESLKRQRQNKEREQDADERKENISKSYCNWNKKPRMLFDYAFIGKCKKQKAAAGD